ncbi:MAG: GAF domain-containing protein, partial [Candidatus Latescibacteria bacterium]|nr:GAF domain-containing protein [Candidatus Latescibacterota bacterium]
MQREYQKLQADLKALQHEVDRLREIERERQHTQKRLEFLLELFSDLDLDLDGVLHRILERLPEVLPDADFGIVYMYDATNGVLVPQACLGADEAVLQRIRLQPGESISGQVFQTGRSQLSTAAESLRSAVETMTPENQALLMEGTAYTPQPASNLCVPLRVGNRTIGTLTVSSSVATYTENDLSLLEGMAGQVSRAVANAQAFEAHVESEAKYRALVDNLPVAISETTPVGEVLFFN